MRSVALLTWLGVLNFHVGDFFFLSFLYMNNVKTMEKEEEIGK